jgi:hypothetical protein
MALLEVRPILCEIYAYNFSYVYDNEASETETMDSVKVTTGLGE